MRLVLHVLSRPQEHLLSAALLEPLEVAANRRAHVVEVALFPRNSFHNEALCRRAALGGAMRRPPPFPNVKRVPTT